MVMEECFHPNLRGSLYLKRETLKYCCHTVWLFANGELIGETYGAQVSELLLHDSLPGLDTVRIDKDKTIYIYSTAIRPAWQGEGLGKILKAYSLGLLRGYFKTVLGHAKEGASIALNQFFGAEIKQRFDNWYDTGQPYYFYKMDLGDNKMMKINYERAMRLAASGKGKLIDTRTPVEFNKGTLEGATNLVLRNISKLVTLCHKTDSVIFFGPDSYMAAQYAFGMGYPKVFFMEKMPEIDEEKTNS